MDIDVIFISRPGCGICMMMQPAWERIMAEKMDWHYFHYNLGVDTVATKIIGDFPNNDGKLPMFCVYKDAKPIGSISGGHKYKDIIKAIEELIDVCK
jgi:hypothetical protein